VGEHTLRRFCSRRGTRSGVAGGGLPRKRRPSAGEGAVRPAQVTRFHDPFAGGGSLPLEHSGSAGGLRERPEPGCGADQQGND